MALFELHLKRARPPLRVFLELDALIYAKIDKLAREAEVPPAEIVRRALLRWKPE